MEIVQYERGPPDVYGFSPIGLDWLGLVWYPAWFGWMVNGWVARQVTQLKVITQKRRLQRQGGERVRVCHREGRKKQRKEGKG